MIAFACPTIDAGGQFAGFASNTFAEHAFCNVVNLDGSCFGRSTLTDSIFDCDEAWFAPRLPVGYTILAVRLAPLALDVFPLADTEKFGLNVKLRHDPIWK